MSAKKSDKVKEKEGNYYCVDYLDKEEKSMKNLLVCADFFGINESDGMALFYTMMKDHDASIEDDYGKEIVCAIKDWEMIAKLNPRLDSQFIEVKKGCDQVKKASSVYDPPGGR